MRRGKFRSQLAPHSPADAERSLDILSLSFLICKGGLRGSTEECVRGLEIKSKEMSLPNGSPMSPASD